MKIKLKKHKHFGGYFYRDKNGNSQGEELWKWGKHCQLNNFKNNRQNGIKIMIIL